MIILGWIGFLLVFIMFIAIIGKSIIGHGTYIEAFIDTSKVFAYIVAGIISFIGLIWLLVILMHITFKNSTEQDTTMILSCNGVIVAESVNGFDYNNRSGTYQDDIGGLVYTPRQGEVCKEYLKGGE